MNIFKAISEHNISIEGNYSNGEIVGISREMGVTVACGNGEFVTLREIQAPGGKRMPSEAYFRGHSEKLHCKFEE